MDDPVTRLVLLTRLAATLVMVGVIWFVQVVHYPLLARVGPATAAGYARAHARRTGFVVGPPMLAGAATAVALLWVRPPAASPGAVWAGLGLLAVVWASTRFVQVPCHEALSRAFDPAVHRWLVLTYWVRTAGWTGRGGYWWCGWPGRSSANPARRPLPAAEAPTSGADVSRSSRRPPAGRRPTRSPLTPPG